MPTFGAKLVPAFAVISMPTFVVILQDSRNHITGVRSHINARSHSHTNAHIRSHIARHSESCYRTCGVILAELCSYDESYDLPT